MIFLRTAKWTFACSLALWGLAQPAQAATYKVLHSLNGSDGANPYVGLIEVGGALYGTTPAGGHPNCYLGCGTVFAVDRTTHNLRTIHFFRGYPNDGKNSQAGLFRFGATLYGTTYLGGAHGADDGTIFSIAPKPGGEKIVHSFTGFNDGREPTAGFIEVAGILYGTTNGGGASDGGTVFSLDPRTGTEKVLHAFGSGKDGSDPSANLLNVGGTLYGTTFEGGSSHNCTFGCGTVFALDPSTGAEKIIYSFKGGRDGAFSTARLIEAGGILYGTTAYGGGSVACTQSPDGCGTVFALDPGTGVERVLHAFTGGRDGAYLGAGLTNVAGVFYGTTNGGASFGKGALFTLNPATGATSVVHAFKGGSDGANPVGDLVDVGGKLYGTTVTGGGSGNCNTLGCGTVFQYKP